MIRKLLAVVALGLSTISAQAADIYTPSYAEPNEIQSINWSGISIGGRIGWAAANHEVTVGDDEADFFGLDGLSSTGLIGGLHAGVDKQMGRVVLGVFGSYDWSDVETTAFIDDFEAAVEKGDEWSLGARAGVLVNPKTLVYGLVAYTETSYTASADCDGCRLEKDLSGITGGAGIEFAIAPNTFAGLEATHTWYDDVEWSDDERFSVVSETDETKIMATVKFKLNAGLLGQ